MLRLPAAAAAVALGLAAAAPPAGAIFHGAPVAAADAPWSVALTGMSLACGGALIAPDRVLTAAHCVQGANPDKLRVRLGGDRWPTGRKLAWRGAFFPKAYRIVPSPEAPGDLSRSATFADVAVIVLRDRVTDVAPLPLATDAARPGEAARTVGRGRTGPRPAPTSERPRAADQQVLDPAECTKAYGSLFAGGDQLCTEDLTATAAQACAGDSGSPVLVQRDGAPAVAGVVAWGNETQGDDCGDGLPDVSARVAAHASLITGAAPARLAPHARRRVRVRRAGHTLRCVVGAWTPSDATFSIRWWRRTDQARVITVGGTRRTRRASPTAKLGCSVTARTAGGWATEDSYNLL
ncbi:MAG TPA: serine protease [Baekduia sp.]|uniref:S1 family peptidase n=1 Tax=Baekduia sp. TaxID=2600305 RepID=UPI002D78BB61|nr:serine protease [Baekduia sp.]HET6505814.1 serine protease [Baekduia sp.]